MTTTCVGELCELLHARDLFFEKVMQFKRSKYVVAINVEHVEPIVDCDVRLFVYLAEKEDNEVRVVHAAATVRERTTRAMILAASVLRIGRSNHTVAHAKR